MSSIGLVAFAALTSALPSAVTLWQGRRIARLVGDPTLPERIFAARRIEGAAVGLCLGLIAAVTGRHAAWAAPALLLLRIAARYPSRKAIHDETWTFASYFSFFTRLIVAVLGFWVLVAVTPLIIAASGRRATIVAAALALILAGWHEFFPRVFRTLMRARPVLDAHLTERFAAMLETCGLRHVELDEIDLRGGALANAVALPSRRGSAVVVTRPLLDQLDPDEVVAILGHELAHIEFHTPRRLRAMSAATYGLMAVALLSPFAARGALPEVRPILFALWLLTLIAVLLIQAGRRQQQETASDLRAIALAPEPEALVRALTKIHVSARLPRRWGADLERNAAHPSLARRIQAIRTLAGAPPSRLGETARFADARSQQTATLHDDHLVWRDQASIELTLPYRDLTSVRCDVRWSWGAPRLVATHRSGRNWSLRLRAEDVGLAQSALDAIDAQLGSEAAPAVQPHLSRVTAILTAVVASLLPALSAAACALVALLWPSAPASAAAGLVSIGAGATALQTVWLGSAQVPWWTSLALFGCGGCLVAIAVATRNDAIPNTARPLTLLLGLAAGVACLGLLTGGTGAIDLHVAAIRWPAAGLLMLGLAGAVAATPPRRWVAAPIGIVGLAIILAGSPFFLAALSGDPLVPRGRAPTVSVADASQVRQFDVPFGADQIAVSRDARYIALGDAEDEDEHRFQAGRIGETLTSFPADDAAFLEDGRLLLVRRQADATDLRVLDLGEAGAERWSATVPVSFVTFRLDRHEGRWQILGWAGHGRIRSVAGGLGPTERVVRQWAVSEPDDDRQSLDIDGLDLAFATADRVLAVEPRYQTSPLAAWLPLEWRRLTAWDARVTSRLWTIGHEGRASVVSRLQVGCLMGATDPMALCVSYDGERSGLFHVGDDAGAIALGAVWGRLSLRSEEGDGWLAGWWHAEPVLIHASSGNLVRAPWVAGETAGLVTRAGDLMVTAAYTPTGTTIRQYRLRPAAIAPR